MERLAGGRDRVAVDGAGVGLRAEGERHRLAAVLSDQADSSGGLPDGIAQQAGHERDTRGPVIIAGGVQPDDGITVTTLAGIALVLAGVALTRRQVKPAGSEHQVE